MRNFICIMWVIVLFLAVLTCCSEGSPDCAAPRGSGTKFSVSGRRNHTGHWLGQIELDQGGLTKEMLVTGGWRLEVDQNVTECGETESVKVIVTVIAPPPLAGPGYTFFPGVGYYKIHNTTATWEEARKTCVKEGAHLAIINSKAEAVVLSELHRKLPSATKYVHIGFHKQNATNEFVTIFGQRLDATGYKVWKQGEPNNSGGNEYCGSITKNAELNDYSCSSRSNFICEQELF